MLKKTIILLLVVFSLDSRAQDIDLLKTAEDSLKIYSEKIITSDIEKDKDFNNRLFTKLFIKTLNQESSYSFPFDSLKKISKLTAPDNTFKIFTWGYKKDDGTYSYFGIIQLRESEYKKLIILKDKSESIESAEMQSLNQDNWYGAIYYQIVLTKRDGRKYYTLLGWDGNNFLTQKKLIEVIWFRSNDRVAFGALIFKKYKDKAQRVVFEYTSRCTMSLRYEKQLLHIVKRSKDKKTKTEKVKKSNMIVFDRLSPIDARNGSTTADLTGQYQFYAPETNILDAFVFENGKWVFVKDVDARNPEVPKKKIDKKSKKDKKKIDNTKIPAKEDENSGE
jgi:hypothetical protein